MVSIKNGPLATDLFTENVTDLKRHINKFYKSNISTYQKILYRTII